MPGPLRTASSCNEILEALVEALSPDKKELPALTVDTLCTWMPDNHNLFARDIRESPMHTFFEDTGDTSYLHEVFRRLRACCDAVDGYKVSPIIEYETGGYSIEVDEPDSIVIKRIDLLIKEQQKQQVPREILYERILSTEGLEPNHPEVQRSLQNTYSFADDLPPHIQNVTFDATNLLKPPDVERTKKSLYDRADIVSSGLPRKSIDSIQQDTLTSIYHRTAREHIVTIHAFWKYCLNNHRDGADKPKHPLAPIVKAYLEDAQTRTLTTATSDHVNKLVAIPKIVSEINRNQWQVYGDTDAVLVDGVPIASKIKEIPLPGKKHKVHTPKQAANSRIQGLLFETERLPATKPIPLLAYEEFGDDLRSSLPADVALSLKAIYAANQQLKVNRQQWAQLLARDRKGKLRNPQPSDYKRAYNALATIMSMIVWYPDSQGIPAPANIANVDRLGEDTWHISTPTWWQRSTGQWTLSGGLAPRRLAGHAESRLARYIDGVEHWLARSRFPNRGKHKGVASSLIPAGNKRTGAGEWCKLDWRTFLTLGGDSWDFKNKLADNASRQRWKRLSQLLETHGYVLKTNQRQAKAGDTIEFRLGRGCLWVRASDRFTEAVRKTQRKEWERMLLIDLINPK